MSRERILYRESYRPGSRRVREDLLPQRFPYMVKTARIKSIEVRAAGQVEVEGRTLEFQDVRVLVDPEGGAA